MSGDERRDERERRRRDRPYRYRDWQADGFRGPPPWRRGYQPWYWVLSIAVAALVLAAVLLLGPGR